MSDRTLALLDTTAALRGLMLLTGAPGTGKSTLIKSWLAGLEPKRFLPLLITQSSLSATGVLEVLLAKLGERARFKRSTNLLLLEKHLPEIAPLSLVLGLDDAQNYPGPALEELRLLLGLGGHKRAGLDRDVFTAAAADMLAEASEGNPRILGLLAQAAWLEATRSGTLNIEPDHVHKALQQAPAASAKIPQP